MFILASVLLTGVSAESPGDMRQKYDIRSQQMLSVSGCIKEEDINYNGHDIGQPKKLESHQACIEHCVSVEEGLFWTYSFTTKTCYIKSSDSGRKSLQSVVSGNRACGLTQQLIPLGVAVSQQKGDTYPPHQNYPPHQCADSNPLTFGVVGKAPFPWLAIYLGSKARVDRVEIWNKKDDGHKLRNFEVRVTDSLPSSGNLCLYTDVFLRGREVRRGNTGGYLQ